MNQVPTVNVFLSSEKKVLQEVLQSLGKTGGTPQSVIEKIDPYQRRGILLFNNYGNPNFISFEHSFNQPDTKAKLKFIDPENKFELNYLATGSIYRGLASVIERSKMGTVKRTEATDAAKESVTIDPLDKEKIEVIKSRSLNKPIFVAYGTGTDQRSWSSVHKMTMTGLTFDPEGSREFTLTMIGGGGGLARQGTTGLFKQPIDFNALGNTISCYGSSKRIRYEEIEKGKTVYGSTGGKYQPIDYHQLICDVLYSYFAKASNGANIVILLPDLNKMLQNYISQVELDYSGKFDSEKFSKSKRQLIITQNVLNSIGLEHYGVPKLKGPDVIPVQAASMSAATKVTEAQRRDYVISSNWYARLCTASEAGTPDLLAPVKRVLEKINKFSPTTIMDVTYFTETDQAILDFWGSKENKSKYTFNGFNEFNPDKPTYVVGHIAEISKLLYPTPKVDKLTKDSAYSRIEQNVENFYYRNTEELGQTYQNSVKSVQQEAQARGTFGSRSAVPDTFGYVDGILSKENIDIIQELNIPVFRHNTSNPNVLNIKLYDDTALYMSILKAGYKKQVDRVASYLNADGKAGVRVRDYVIKTEAELVDAINVSRYSHFGSTVSQEEQIEKIVNSVDSSLKNQLSQKRGEQVDIAKLVKAVLDSLDGDSLEIKVGQTVNSNPAQLLTEMANQLGKKTTRIQIKCLPMFSLSTRTGTVMTPAVVFSQSLPMIGQRRRTRFDNFLTGIYAIVGFKHTISQNTVQSEFVLTRRNLSLLDSIGGGEKLPTDDYEEVGITNTFSQPTGFDVLNLEIATPEEVEQVRSRESAEQATTEQSSELPAVKPKPQSKPEEKAPEAIEVKVDDGFREPEPIPQGQQPLPMDILEDNRDLLRRSTTGDKTFSDPEPLEPGYYSRDLLYKRGLVDEPEGSDEVYYPGDNL